METTAFVDIIDYVGSHTYMQQSVIVFSYILLAKGCDILINRFLRRLVSKTSASFDDTLIDCMHRPVYWSVFCLGLLHALLFTSLPSPWQTALPAVIKTVILLLWIFAVAKILDRLAKKEYLELVARRQVSGDFFNLSKKVLRTLLFVLGFLWVLSIWNVSLTPLFASAGIAGIAIALAVKDTLANFFGGISMFMDKTFKEGDYIILDSGERGEVKEIGMRSTRIKTRDDVLITVPNSILATTKIINESAPEPRFRIRIAVGVAYGSNIDKVEELLLQVAGTNEEVAANPEPRVRMRAFGASSLDFELLCWVREPSHKGLVTHHLLKGIYHIFEDENIVIPFPQMDVNVVENSVV